MISPLQPGYHTIYIRAWDDNGNFSEGESVFSYQFKIEILAGSGNEAITTLYIGILILAVSSIFIFKKIKPQ